MNEHLQGHRIGKFACAVVHFIKAVKKQGLQVYAGQSDSDDLDFCLSLYLGKTLAGCVSFHLDGTYSMYVELDGREFREESAPWFTLPEGFTDAIERAFDRELFKKS